MTTKQTTHVALLRGINVGGKNMLPMKALAAMFVDAGCTRVTTYIQSGNVVFDATPAASAKIGAIIERAIDDGFGLRVPVVQRSSGELARVAAENPFLSSGVDPATLHVAFLGAAPTATQVASLDPDRSPQDRFVVRGRDVFLHLPNGVAKTKLSNAWLDTKLRTTSTVRKWRTVLKLVELCGSAR